ncbi:MAG TPA: type II secretion system F family protein [Candidatus Eisenbacteria bacterium]|nr:type II secretion system F family protein [Candidatus Eisenbacteria bacterium]
MIFVLVSILIFAATAALVAAMLTQRRERENLELKQRVGGGERGGSATGPVVVERDTRMSTLPFLDEFLKKVSAAKRLELLLYQAGLGMRVATFLAAIAASAMACYLASFIIFGKILHSIVFMGIGGFLPVLWVMHKKNARMKAFAEEFPDTLDLLVSALRAGISFSGALQIVADESPEPVRSEFAIVVEEQALGLDLREALGNLATRVDSLDLKFFVTAVVLQKDTGGNLTEVLENTGKLIRDRFRILGDIMTFTAQGRMTGMILTCLPLGLAIFMAMLAPDYFGKMWNHPNGRAILGFAALMQIMGGLAIRKIVDIKV